MTWVWTHHDHKFINTNAPGWGHYPTWSLSVVCRTNTSCSCTWTCFRWCLFCTKNKNTHTAWILVLLYDSAAMDPSLCPVSIWWAVSSTRNVLILVSLVAAIQWQKHSESPTSTNIGVPWNSGNLLSLKDGDGLVLFLGRLAAYMRCYGKVPTRKIKKVQAAGFLLMHESLHWEVVVITKTFNLRAKAVTISYHNRIVEK